MLRIRSKSGNRVTPPLPLSWDGQESLPADSASESMVDESLEQPSALATPQSIDRKPASDPDHDNGSLNKESALSNHDNNKLVDSSEADPEITTMTKPEPATPVTNLDEIPDQLGQLLLSLRAQAGLTTQELADRAITTETCIQDLEQGNYNNLPADFFCLSVIERICNIYNMDPKQLLELFRQESLAAGRSPSGFQDALLASDQTKLSPHSPLGAFNRKKFNFGSHRSGRTTHRLLGLLLGLLVASFVILLGMAIIYQVFLRQNTASQVPEMTDTSILITPQRPPADELQIY